MNKYKKLKDITLEFSKHINIIAGTNGSCKTSLLHIISNSFQMVNRKCDFITDKTCLDCIRQINNSINPKIETLTKGDKKFNDPAPGHKGDLYTVKFINGLEMKFRRHESKKNDRYSIKPYYKKGASEKLPFIFTIYLGLSRLFPFGEYQNDKLIKTIKKGIPQEYQEEINRIYKELINIDIQKVNHQLISDIKTRSEFTTVDDGIDSNTISSGEDNLYIILTALISLKYYYNSIQSNNDCESLLLIDEFDATLHPALQNKLLQIFYDFSKNYKIQIFLTTHSLSLIEYALKNKFNVLYLINNVHNILTLPQEDIVGIKADLNECTRNDILQSKKICIWMEDDEARDFWNELKDFYCEKDPNGFGKIANYFHLVNISIGSTNLINIFSDIYLLNNTLKSICILDGDKNSNKNLNKNIICLPGNNSPEKLLIAYSFDLYENDSEFWEMSSLKNSYNKRIYTSNFKNEIDKINEEIERLRVEGKSHGKERELYKDFYKERRDFFILLIRYWIRSKAPKNELAEFYKEIFILFKKLAESHDIPSSLWLTPIDIT